MHCGWCCGSHSASEIAMIRAVVGAGGKTSLIRAYTEEFRRMGKKVFVTTSTHMFIEEDTLLTDDAAVLLRALEEKGYVIRQASASDKRILLVYPTDKANQLIDRIFACYSSWSSYLTQDFTEEEKETLSRLMARISTRAEDYVKGGDGSCELSENT